MEEIVVAHVPAKPQPPQLIPSQNSTPLGTRSDHKLKSSLLAFLLSRINSQVTMWLPLFILPTKP